MAATLPALVLSLLLLLPRTGWCQRFAMDDSDDEAPGGVISVGALIPHSVFRGRYRTPARKLKVTTEINRPAKSDATNATRTYFEYRLRVVGVPHRPSPNEILEALCGEFLNNNVMAIIYLTNTEPQRKHFSSAEYFLQLANYIGIPVISWNSASSGLEKKFVNSLVLHLAPTLSHQVSAMLSMLRRYEWKKFSVVTSHIGGHDDFVQSVLQELYSIFYLDDLQMIHRVTVTNVEDKIDTINQLSVLTKGDARALLLHCTEIEAVHIFEAAAELNLTRKDFVWIVTQSVVLHQDRAPKEFPVGLLGVDFDSGITGLTKSYLNSIRILGYALDSFVSEEKEKNETGNRGSTHNCLDEINEPWIDGVRLRKHLLDVSIQGVNEEGNPEPQEFYEFKPDGTLKVASLDIVNLDADRKWIKVGKLERGSLLIRDIVWPGNSNYPPYGEPENYNLKVVFLEEPPYVNMEMPDNNTGVCSSHAVKCRVPPVPHGKVDPTGVGTNFTQYRCCSGFCVDLMKKLAQGLSFTYEMQRVADGLWGAPLQNGTWNGMMAELIEKKVDMAMTALKINSHREKYVDFSIPYLETGISVVVAKRIGIISPKAFLEPFDMISWFFVLIISLQGAALSIFAFEWFSPSGYNMKLTPAAGHRFSLFRTYWLVWAMLFGASVNVVAPRGYTARFMSNVWAAFTKVFLALYTANLAAFMITREDFYDLNGVVDHRLLYPFSQNPALRFGTVPFGNTDDVLKSNFPQMHSYMRKHNRSTVKAGVAAIKNMELDAFVYDSTVLEYLVGQDDGCRLLTVGNWYAMTGYGIAFPKKSSSGHLERFNEALLYFRDNGELERLAQFWLVGACKLHKDDDEEMDDFRLIPISLKQFTSAFFLLFTGLALSLVLLGLEALYFVYLREPLARRQKRDNCCTLISLNLAHSLTFEDVVNKAQDIHKFHKCKDPICDTILWKVRHQLDFARLETVRLKVKVNKLENALQLAGPKLPTSKLDLSSQQGEFNF